MFSSIRVLIYFLVTALIFIISFFPFAYTLFYIIESGNLLVYFMLPIILSVSYLFTLLIFGILHPILAVKLILPNLKPGVYKHDSSEAKLIALRLTCDSILKSMIKVYSWVPFITGRVLMPKLLRLYGLKIGKGTHISSQVFIDANNLIEIGKNCFIGWNSAISCHYNVGNKLVVDKVIIGDNVTIGVFAIIAPGVEIGNNTTIGTKALTLPNVKYDSNSLYAGIPAKKVKDLN